MENKSEIKLSIAALLLTTALSISNIASAVVEKEARVIRHHQTESKGLHQKYKDLHHKKHYRHHKQTHRYVRDIDLIADHPSITKNCLLRHYMNRILNSHGNEKEVEKYIWLINELPGYDIEYDFRPLRGSTNHNDVELVLKINRTKGKLSIEASNHGVKDIGKYQFVGTGQILNPFGWNDSFTLSLGTSDKPSSLFLVTGGYSKKISTYGTEFNLVASHVQDDAFREQGFSNTKNNKSNYIRGEVIQPIIVNNKNGLDLGLGTDRRDVKNFDSAGVKNSEYDYGTGFIFVKGRHRDFLQGENVLQAHFYNSLGGVDVDVLAAGERVFDRNFSYVTLDYRREQPISKFFKNNHNKFLSNLNFVMHMVGHYSSDALPLENQFFVGGAHQGKGYRSGLISSNRGFLFYKEIQYNHQMNNKFITKLQPYIFQEGVYISKTRDPISRKQFFSAGGGLRVATMHNIFVDLEVAAPFRKNIFVSGIKRENPVRFNALIFKEISF